MKILAKPVETIVFTDKNGTLRPLRFKYDEDNLSQIIIIDQIVQAKRTTRAGEDALVFTCESDINGVKKVYELRYTLSTTTWVLYKM